MEKRKEARINKIELFTFGFLKLEKDWENLWSSFSNKNIKGMLPIGSCIPPLCFFLELLPMYWWPF